MDHEIIEDQPPGLGPTEWRSSISKVHEWEQIHEKDLCHLKVFLILENDQAISSPPDKEIYIILEYGRPIQNFFFHEVFQFEQNILFFDWSSLIDQALFLCLVLQQNKDRGAKNKAKVSDENGKSLCNCVCSNLVHAQVTWNHKLEEALSYDVYQFPEEHIILFRGHSLIPFTENKVGSHFNQV